MGQIWVSRDPISRGIFRPDGLFWPILASTLGPTVAVTPIPGGRPGLTVSWLCHWKARRPRVHFFTTALVFTLRPAAGESLDRSESGWLRRRGAGGGAADRWSDVAPATCSTIALVPDRRQYALHCCCSPFTAAATFNCTTCYLLRHRALLVLLSQFECLILRHPCAINIKCTIAHIFNALLYILSSSCSSP